MARPVYEWTRPSDGQVFKWSPLTAGDEMDTEGAFNQPQNKHLRIYELYARRIRNEQGGVLSSSDLRSWEADDVSAFMIDSANVEAARTSAFRKPQDGALGIAENAVADVKKAQQALALALDAFLASARALPLGKPGA